MKKIWVGTLQKTVSFYIMVMKTGDLVEAYESAKTLGIDYGLGILLDSYEDDNGILYFEVQWKHERQWFAEQELKVISEDR